MQKELPEFEGRDVQAALLKFSGKVTQRVGALGQGEHAIIIAKVQVSGVTHQDHKAQTGASSPKLFSRVHQGATVRAVVLSQEDGERLLEEAIELADEKFGIQNLFSEITEGTDSEDNEE